MPQESDAQRFGRWIKKSFNDWKAGAANGAGHGCQEAAAAPPGDLVRLVRRWDPWPELVKAMGEREQLHTLVMGTDGRDLMRTAPRRNLLILGPPRSDKTAGVLTLTILNHPGPVISTSTKADVLRATGLIRARLGRVWHYAPDGGETPPGCTELRWSPIPPSARWRTAIALGKAMADVSETGAGEHSDYFRAKAGVLIAALLHAAALGGKPMLWLMRAANGEPRILDEALEILDDSFEADTQIALSDLRGVVELDERSKSSIFSTTANAFAAYRLPGALVSTEPGKHGYFDPAAFVAGEPGGWNPFRVTLLGEDASEMDRLANTLDRQGRFDTVYITASSEQQKLVAPLVAAFLSQTREAAFNRHRDDEAKDNFSRPALLWALDEIAGIAPMRDLPETLSQSGGQNLIVAACLQDLQIARARWDKGADAFLTLFGNVVIHAGIRDESTLRTISTVIGQHWVPVWSEGKTKSDGRSGGNRHIEEGSQWTETHQYVARLDPGAIASGKVDKHSSYVLGLGPGLGPGNWRWFFCMPYFSTPPWPQMLITNMEYVARVADELEACWTIPAPILDQDGSGEHLLAAAYGDGQLLERYKTARQQLRALAERRAQLRASFGEDSLLTGYDDSGWARLPAPVRVFIALKGTAVSGDSFDVLSAGPSLAKIAGSLEVLSEIRKAGPDDSMIVNIDTTLATGEEVPFDDLAEDAFFEPTWVVEVGRHRAGLAIVAGGLGDRAKTTPVKDWGDRVTETGVLLEAWCTSTPALHMIRRLAGRLQTLSPSAYLDAHGCERFGTWDNTSEMGE